MEQKHPKKYKTGFTPLEISGKNNSPKERKMLFLTGFTVIELLIVIAVIGILASVLITRTFTGAKQARDTRRIQEVYQVSQSLHLYYSTYGVYPENNDTDDPGCDNIHGVVWDGGNVVFGADDNFVKPVYDEKFMGVLPKEWTGITDPWGSRCIYRYTKMADPCDGQCAGTYAILYAACESPNCPVDERPSCCDGSSWLEGSGAYDEYDIFLFLEEK